MLIKFIVAIIVLVYAALQTDLNRKCKKKNAVADSQSNTLQFINITMLALATAGVLFFGYHLLVPSASKVKFESYF